MRFADLQRFTLSQCFVELDQWGQVITDQVLSPLVFCNFFLGLVLVGGFGPGTTAEVTSQYFFTTFFLIILG